MIVQRNCMHCSEAQKDHMCTSFSSRMLQARKACCGKSSAPCWLHACVHDDRAECSAVLSCTRPWLSKPPLFIQRIRRCRPGKPAGGAIITAIMRTRAGRVQVEHHAPATHLELVTQGGALSRAGASAELLELLSHLLDLSHLRAKRQQNPQARSAQHSCNKHHVHSNRCPGTLHPATSAPQGCST